MLDTAPRTSAPDPPTSQGARVTLASPGAVDAAIGRDRRAYFRHPQSELSWIRAARLQFGQSVTLVDLSKGGVRLRSSVALGPNSISALEIVTGGAETVVPFRVLRCEVGGLRADGITYQGACQFIQPLNLPDLATGNAQSAPPADIAQLDLALKALIARAGADPGAERLAPEQILVVLKALHLRAARTYTDTAGQRLTAMLHITATAIEQRRGVAGAVEAFEHQLRRMVPQARVRLAGAPSAPLHGMSEIMIGVPGMEGAGPLVIIALPTAASLTPWQSHVLRATSRLIMLLQRVELAPSIFTYAPTIAPESPAAPETGAPQEAGTVSAAAARLPEPVTCTVDASPFTWQMVVIRYADGRTRKGFTCDFHELRPHFTLRTQPSLTEGDCATVSIARLKAVFFVRDFDGNPCYIERTDGTEPEEGRRIQVTLSDGEVLAGTAPDYHTDGQGFFVTPLDPATNNIRVFIVAKAVRQVRFPNA